MKNLRTGISMIALIITIVVLVIITGVIVLKLTDTNIMELGNEGSFKANIKNYETDLADYIGNQDMEFHGKYDKNVLYADSLTARYGGEELTGISIQDIIPSLTPKDLDRFVIEEGMLKFAGVKAKEQKWAKEIGIGTSVSYIKDHMVVWLDALNNTGTGHNDTSNLWKDLSGKKNNATLEGFSFNSDNGWNENSLKLNGNMYCIVKGNTDFSNFKTGVPFTYGATFKTNETVPSWMGVLSTVKPNEASNAGINGFNIQFGTKSSIGSYISGTGEPYLVKPDAVVTPLTNYSIYVTYDGRIAKLYMNGQLVNTTQKDILATTENLVLGGFYTNVPGGKFSLYGVYVYDKELTAEEIKHNYTVDKLRFQL